MKKHVYAFIGIFSFLTMIIAPVIAITHFPSLFFFEVAISLMNAVAISAVVADLAIGTFSVLMAMKDLYKESVESIKRWLWIALFTSLCQYLFLVLGYISTL